MCCCCCFFCKQKTAYEMRISDWSLDVCSSDLHQRGDAVDAEGDAAVRRRAVPERVEQEAELGLGLLRADAQQLEHRALHRRAMDADRAAADLVAVEHHVVATADRGPGIRAQVRLVVDRRRGERVVDRKSPRLNSRHYCASRMPAY